MSTIKQRWIEALKGGNYKQGKSMLRTPDNEFCCLGVLEDITCGSSKQPSDYNTVNATLSFETMKHLKENYQFDITCNGLIPETEENINFISELLKKKEITLIHNGVQLDFESTINDRGLSLALLNDFGVDFKTIAEIVDFVY